MMDIIERQRSDEDGADAEFCKETPVTLPQGEPDPFAHARPIHDLSVLIGGLPDTREAEEILHDLARCRMKRTLREPKHARPPAG